MPGRAISFQWLKFRASILLILGSGLSNVLGGTANSNSDWDFVENDNSIIVTAKAGKVLPYKILKVLGYYCSATLPKFD